MIMISDDKKSLVISYDLKVEIDKSISDLNLIIIKMGIKSWDKYIDGFHNVPDFYLFSDFRYLETEEKYSDINLRKEDCSCKKRTKSKLTSRKHLPPFESETLMNDLISLNEKRGSNMTIEMEDFSSKKNKKIVLKKL